MFYLGWLLMLMLKTSLMAQWQGWALGLMLGVFCLCVSGSTVQELWGFICRVLETSKLQMQRWGSDAGCVFFLSAVGLPGVSSVQLSQLAKLLHLGVSAKFPAFHCGGDLIAPFLLESTEIQDHPRLIDDSIVTFDLWGSLENGSCSFSSCRLPDAEKILFSAHCYRIMMTK